MEGEVPAIFFFGQLCFQFPLNLVGAEPGPEWKWKCLRVGEGLSTAFSTQSWGGEGYRLADLVQASPTGAQQCWENVTQANLHLTWWSWWTTPRGKGNEEQTFDLRWSLEHTFLWSFIIFHLVQQWNSREPPTAFLHCYSNLLLLHVFVFLIDS